MRPSVPGVGAFSIETMPLRARNPPRAISTGAAVVPSWIRRVFPASVTAVGAEPTVTGPGAVLIWSLTGMPVLAFPKVMPAGRPTRPTVALMFALTPAVPITMSPLPVR